MRKNYTDEHGGNDTPNGVSIAFCFVFVTMLRSESSRMNVGNAKPPLLFSLSLALERYED